MRAAIERRGSGVLMHVSSLPGAFGIGDFGPCAYRFADFLAQAGFTVWQTLPLGPVTPESGNSPYSGCSAFAGDTRYISPEKLTEDALVREAEIAPYRKSVSRTDYTYALECRGAILRTAWSRFCERPAEYGPLSDAFAAFCAREREWLDDYTLYCALKAKFGGAAWSAWPAEYRMRDADAIGAFLSEEGTRAFMRFASFTQFLFFRQCEALHGYCAAKGIRVAGDLPIYVAYDSADVWARPHYFDLDENGCPRSVAGVPPDYFSETGQRWGNPLYRWDRMEEDGFLWWKSRLRAAFQRFDAVRVDHFRGFCGYWAIPAGDETAGGGTWHGAPGEKLFDALRAELSHDGGALPVIAEDLGVITDDVRVLMRKFGFPGMKVLQFAFEGNVGANAYAPHNYERNCVCYTGTHDNDTSSGWWAGGASERERQAFARYAGQVGSASEAAREMVRLALASVADLAVAPVQDLLRLGSEARMNVPGQSSCCWEWRMDDEQFASLFARAEEMFGENLQYGRILSH